MKKMKIVLVMMISLGILLFIAPKTEVNAASKMTLSQLKAKFPHGKYWNHIGSSKNNPNGVTSRPCTHHGYQGSGCSYDGSCGCNATSSSHQAIQCAGYAYKLGLDAFGSDPKYWSQTSSRSYVYDKLKAGDYVRINRNSHSIFITGVSGNTVTYTHCNVDGQCKIEWGRTMSKSELASKLTYIRIAPSTFSKYAMDIHYDNNGGSGSVSKQMVAYESSFTISSANKLSKEGYSFDGFYLQRNQDKKFMCEDGNWYSEDEINEKQLNKKVYQPKEKLKVSKEWTSEPSKQTKFIFIAKWKENSFTLEFDANGGEGEIDSMTGIYGSELILPKSQFLKKNYTFDGFHLYSRTQDKWLYVQDDAYVWLDETKARDLQKVTYQSDEVLEGIYPSKDEEFVACVNWKLDTMRVVYNCYSHDSLLSETIISHGETAKLEKNTCEKPGYTFKGWQAYSMKLSQNLYSYNGELIWSDERSATLEYTPVVFADESEISYISPVSDDVIILQSVWQKDGSGEVVVEDYHIDLITKHIAGSLTSSKGSLLQSVISVFGGLIEILAF